MEVPSVYNIFDADHHISYYTLPHFLILIPFTKCLLPSSFSFFIRRDPVEVLTILVTKKV